jgi:hypothetical protein
MDRKEGMQAHRPPRILPRRVLEFSPSAEDDPAVRDAICCFVGGPYRSIFDAELKSFVFQARFPRTAAHNDVSGVAVELLLLDRRRMDPQ